MKTLLLKGLLVSLTTLSLCGCIVVAPRGHGFYHGGYHHRHW